MRIVQICGQNPSIADAPVIEGAERWILGAAYGSQGEGPWTRLFDVHDPAYIRERRPQALAWYAEQVKTMYFREPLAEVPQGRVYPRDSVQWMFGQRGGRAISSSIDQMLALAILEGFDVIRLDGIRMISVEEWETQRECLAYWIGQAEARGIQVLTDPIGAFCLPEVVYGFDEVTGARRAPGQPLIVHGMPGVQPERVMA